MGFFGKKIDSNKSFIDESFSKNNEMEKIVPEETIDKLKENFLQENKGMIEISQQRKDEKKNYKDVEKILYENDLDKLKYFIRRFFLENIGKEPKLSIDSKGLQVDFGILEFKVPVSEIILNIIKDGKLSFGNLDYYEVLKGEFFALKISSYKFLNFEIIPLSSVNENFLKELKEVMEKYFLPHLENINEYKLSEEEIAKILELDSSDKISYLDEKLNILLNIKNIENIDYKSLLFIANSIANKLGGYLIRVENNWLKTYLEILDKSTDSIYRIILTIDTDFLINIESEQYKKKITRKFLQVFVKSLIFYIKQFSNQEENFIENLKNLGVKVEQYSKRENIEDLFKERGFIGYEDIKEQIITHVISPWRNKEKYESFTRDMLPNIKNIIPNAVLFYGVPGTGKTTMASIIGEYLGYPFVYIPVNSIMSKWFGESENRLNDILETCGKLAKKEGGVVIMIDEIDEIGKNRESTSSDTSNRILGVLLKKLDGLERLDNILLIGGTNLSTSLDPALLSRFSQQIEFRLPNEEEILSILKYYLPILGDDSGLKEIVKSLKGKSGRDIKKISEDFARYIVKNDIKENYIQEFKEFIS